MDTPQKSVPVELKQKLEMYLRDSRYSGLRANDKEEGKTTTKQSKNQLLKFR